MLSSGTRLGRYEVLSPLGAGGMGEVYRARDTELDRAVALKVLPEDVAAEPARLKRFEREAKATAALSHPNVLTVFDVGREDGRAYLVSELLEGSTLGTRLARGPLPLSEALSHGAQIARGLAAAHAHGVVHRDLKPDNLFLTTAGVVKILDFGLARVQPSGERATTASDVTGPGTVMGTLSYMSPEQAKGRPGDSRSDIFALGTVLYEMLSGGHPFKRPSTAETLTAILRDEPPELAGLESGIPIAVERLVRRCLEKRPEDRFQTASDLAVVLEALTPSGEGDRRESVERELEERPYPGLASFMETEATRFFGRETEIASLLEKIRRQSLLAVIGPSGAGKTSLLRAGLVPQRPPGWSALYLTPGPSPVASLGRALAPELAADPGALGDLVHGLAQLHEAGGADRLVAALARWKEKAGEALLIVDQFEETFTLNLPESQERFVVLLGRAATEAGVHLLLSLRDDFLFRCHSFPSLLPVFHDLTPLGLPSPEALRRALVEPAARLGVRFEDEALVGEMVATVEKERGALPLLAFAISRLWEERDRERRLLTREAYARLGGVEGALAQHAEATLQEIGPSREGHVREIFRNLVTAEGTRAVRGREDLLSIFTARPGGRKDGETVLDSLVSARLLTEYDAPDLARPAEVVSAQAPTGRGEREGARIEIVHESLLSHWPRLERWLAQDAEGALLRDQLRQAAHLWDGRGRAEELLWTGRAYREYAVWRERYAGALSVLEEDFAWAMVSLAGRRRRRRRIAGAAALLMLGTGLAVTATLWTRSEIARKKADAETRRAEASKLLAFAQLEVETAPSTALAYATRSLDLADTPEGRLFAFRILQESPVAGVIWLDEGRALSAAAFSPGGEWLAAGSRKFRLFDRDGRRAFTVLGDDAEDARAVFGLDGKVLVTATRSEVRGWSAPEGAPLFRIPHEEGDTSLLWSGTTGFVTSTTAGGATLFRSWRPDGTASRVIARVEPPARMVTAAASGEWLAYSQGRKVYLLPLARPGAARIAVEAPEEVGTLALDARAERLAEIDGKNMRVWALQDNPAKALRVYPGLGGFLLRFDPTGHWLVAFNAVNGSPRGHVFDLQGPPDAEPVLLKRSDENYLTEANFDPSGRWLAAAQASSLAMWAIGERRSHVIAPERGVPHSVAFAPDGQSILTTCDLAEMGAVCVYPLAPDAPRGGRFLIQASSQTFSQMALDPGSRSVAFSPGFGALFVLPLGGGPAHRLTGFSDQAGPGAVAFGDGGRLVAAGPLWGPVADKVVRIFDLRTGATEVLGPVPGAGEGSQGQIGFLQFLDEHRLLVANQGGGLRLYDRRRHAFTTVAENVFTAAGDERLLLGIDADGFLVRLSLDGRPPVRSRSHSGANVLAVDVEHGLVATATQDGTVRIGPVSGEEPNLLLGHKNRIWSLAFSHDGKWLVTGSEDGTIRLWPVPDVTKTPFHMRSHEEVMATLRSFTNLRQEADPRSPTGYTGNFGPFPGWAKLPEW